MEHWRCVFRSFFAVPLRDKSLFGRSVFLFVLLLIIRLRFPSGHATATVISVLHDKTHVEPRLELSWHTKINSLMLSFMLSSVLRILLGQATNNRQSSLTFSRFYHLYQYFHRILKITIYGRSPFLRRISVKESSWDCQRHCQCSLEHY